MLEQKGYKPLKNRVDAILRIEPLTNIMKVREFLGIINFNKNHIPNKAIFLEPITRLTKKEVPFIWGEEQTAAIAKIKAVIAKSIMLVYPDPNTPFTIYPDAANKVGMGAILEQEENTVAVFSKKFNDAQLKYPITEQELLAATDAYDHFGPIIKGYDLTIKSDHMNLIYEAAKHKSNRVLRQKVKLDHEYCAKWEHITGRLNQGGDGFSRLVSRNTEPTDLHAIRWTREKHHSVC